MGSGSKPRLLLVDDEPDLLTLYESVLGSQYRTDRASDGRQALKAISERQYDLVISDISMPHTTGVQLLEQIRSADQDLPVILVTAQPTVDSAMEAVEYGALRYLEKPVDANKLRKLVVYGIRQHEIARAKRRAYQQIQTIPLNASTGTLSEQLDAALAALKPHFQPIVQWSTQSTHGFELLLRAPDSELSNPLEIIRTAELLGRVHELGRLIRQSAAQSAKRLADDQLLFVNVHHLDLDDPELFDAGAPLSQVASQVVLEINERTSLERVRNVRERITLLRRMGFKVAMDDLGAEYSGLNVLTEIEPDVVKFDMHLTRDMDRGGIRKKVVRSMCEMCEQLGIQVIGEGIETAGERDALAAMGCDYMQGHLFGRPGLSLNKPR